MLVYLLIYSCLHLKLENKNTRNLGWKKETYYVSYYVTIMMRLSTDKKRFTYCAITHEYDTINHKLQKLYKLCVSGFYESTCTFKSKHKSSIGKNDLKT